ncbi:C4-dicarboxylate ABC transporter [Actinocorallia longicatena]|uniref:TDT family transporter n=1 Tax=Actinocorallia longicatena TaxID=111803 RepID=A0ABP6QM04_9ACTN
MDLLERPALPPKSRPVPVRERVGPGWFASVMGTGIVANAAAGQGLTVPAAVLWTVAAALLTGLCALLAAQFLLSPGVAAAQAVHPLTSRLWGAPPMALMTVGAGALLSGRPLLGGTAALAIAWPLWTLGTLLGLLTAVAVPAVAAARRSPGDPEPYGTRLMPVVPPVVSAACGALFLPFLGGPARTAMTVVCLVLLGVGVLGAGLVLPGPLRRLREDGPGPAASVPSWWIVLGPLGQSATAAAHLAHAHPGRTALALGFAVPALVLALLCLVPLTVLTLRTARRGLPFSLSWWAFVFPLGTVATGAAGLASLTALPAVPFAAVLLFAALATVWATVAARTLRGLVAREAPAGTVPAGA